MYTISNTAMVLPSRAKLRSDNELPRCKKSSTARELPKRAKLRKESTLPMWTKSIMETNGII
jgi:hypothetical protein